MREKERKRARCGPIGNGHFGVTARGGGAPRVPPRFVHDSPAHVTDGSHRGDGQSETRGQRVRAACLFHCLCGVPLC